MKKLILLTFVLFSLATHAQDTKIGLKAGINYSNLSGDDADAFNAYTQYHGGLLFHFSLAENLIFQPELLYSRQGAEIENAIGDSAFSGELDLSYLTVPLLVKFKFAERFGIYVGPQFGLILNSESTVGETTRDVEDQFSTFDFSGVAGVEIDLPLDLIFGARYVLSLTSIGESYSQDRDAQGNPIPDGRVPAPDLKNAILQAYVGITF